MPIIAAKFKKKSLTFLTTISLLNCPPLPGSVPVGLHWESWIEREKVTSSTHEFNFSMCEPSLLSMQHETDFVLSELSFAVLHTKLAGFTH